MRRLLIFCAHLLLAGLSSCACRYGAMPQSNVAVSTEPSVIEKPQSDGKWTRIEVPLGKRGDVIAFGSDGRAIIAGQGTLLVSLDKGRTWRALSGGEGDSSYTTDGGVTYRKNNDNRHSSSTVSVNELCSVESAVFAPLGRLYLFSMCDHSAALWSISTGNFSGAWHVRGFAPSQEEYEDGGNYYAPRDDLVVAGVRVLVSATLPDGTALLTTDDDGATWYPFWRDPRAAPVIALDFIDDRQGWMLQGDGRLLRTEESGRAWLPVSTLPAEVIGRVFSLDFTSITTGFVAGKHGLILATKDGGRTWQRQDSGTQNNIHEVKAANDKHAWAVGDNGLVLETNDGGTHWQKVELGTSEDIYAVEVKDGVAWLVAGKYLFHSP